MPTIKVPGIGPVEKKWVYVGGAVVAGIVGYAYWNRSRAAAAETAIDDYTTIEPDYAMDGGVDEYVNPGGSQEPVEEDYITAPTTNGEWSQKAIRILIDTGHDPIEAALAVGRYMARQTLSSTQANMIRSASAQLGPPPVGDFPVTNTPSTPTPEPAPKLVAPTGIRQVNAYRTSVTLDWKDVPGAYGYTLYKEGYAPNIGTTFDSTQSVGGLKPDTTTRIRIRAYDKDKNFGPYSSYFAAKTKK